MTDTTMPTTEAGAVATERDLATYELAYHVLPTVAEGEVDGVSAELKSFITQAGGTITDEEVAEHFELAYEIEKYLEGKYRRFGTAFFGWIRFSIDPTAVPAITDEVEAHKSILRSLVIRLTKAEEQNPFRFHAALAESKVRTINTDDVVEGEEEVVVDAEVEAVAETAEKSDEAAA